MKRLISVFVIFLILVLSCEKEHKPETIYPKDFYPVYPGSWWQYLENDTLTVFDRVSDNYMEHSYKVGRDGDTAMSETVKVPFLNGNPIYGYEFIEHIDSPFGNFYIPWPILSEEIGFEFERGFFDKRMGDGSEYVLVKGKFIEDNEEILILTSHWGSECFERFNISFQKYVKGVGLTFWCIVDTTTMDTIYKKELVDYHINH